MTAAERQQVLDIAELQVNRYFDHYLTEVFPRQVAVLLTAHDQSVMAHAERFATHQEVCPMRGRLDRWKWMIVGGSGVAGVVGTLLVQNIGPILKALT